MKLLNLRTNEVECANHLCELAKLKGNTFSSRTVYTVRILDVSWCPCTGPRAILPFASYSRPEKENRLFDIIDHRENQAWLLKIRKNY